MCPSQQDGIFDCGQDPEHLSLQHLSILFCLPPNKTRASDAKYSQEQHWAADRQGRSGVCGCTSWSVTQTSLWLYSARISLCFDLFWIMTSNKEATLFDTMTAAPEVSYCLDTVNSLKYSFCSIGHAIGLNWTGEILYNFFHCHSYRTLWGKVQGPDRNKRRNWSLQPGKAWWEHGERKSLEMCPIEPLLSFNWVMFIRNTWKFVGGATT